jgi:hypothetical protein
MGFSLESYLQGLSHPDFKTGSEIADKPEQVAPKAAKGADTSPLMGLRPCIIQSYVI